MNENNNTEVANDNTPVTLTPDELRKVLKGNFTAILEGFKTFEELVISTLRDNNKETTQVIEDEASDFFMAFEVARRRFSLNLMEIALEIEKSEGKKRNKNKMGFGFTAELEDKAA